MGRRFAHLGDVEALIVVVEHGSLTAGAIALGTTPSVLSRAIARLEARLGCQLLRRTTRSIGLTDAGRLYLEQSKSAFALIDDAERAIQGEHGVVSGRIRLSVPTTYGHYLDRNSRLEELRRRWDEEHAKLKALVVMYRQKAAYNSGMAPKLQAAETRLRRFVETGPPQAVPTSQRLRIRLTGGRTAKRAVVCDRLELTGLMAPFDAEIWFGERLAVLGYPYSMTVTPDGGGAA